MAMMEPFMPHPDTEQTVAAADAGPGAPDAADGFGVETSAEEFRREGRDPLTHEPVDDGARASGGEQVGDEADGSGSTGGR